MKPPPFAYRRPRSLEESAAVLAEHGDDAALLAGGQSLMPLLALRLATPAVLVDLNELHGLGYVHEDSAGLRIGALARQRTVERLRGLRERCAMVAEAAAVVGHVAIRNRGTVVGSMVHAHPVAEWPAVAVALSAEFDAMSAKGRRTIPAEDFFRSSFTTALAPEEIVTEVRLPLPAGRVGSCFVELARRHGDFAIVGAGALLRLGDDDRIEDARVVVVGVGPTVMRIGAAEGVLVGSPCTAGLLADAADAVSGVVDPPTDIHGSAVFRRAMARTLARRALISAHERAAGDGRG